MNKILTLFLVAVSINNFVYGQVNISEARIPYELLIEDYDYLLEVLQETPPLVFTFIDKNEFRKKTNSLRTSIAQPLTIKEFNKIVLKTVALLNTKSALMIGDAGFSSYLKNGGLSFPFTIKYLSGNIYIDENFSTNDTLIRGAEIIAINEIQIQSIIKELSLYLRVRLNGSIAQQLSYHWADLLWLHYGFYKEFKLSYKLPNDPEIKTSIVQGINKKPKTNKTKANNLNLRIDVDRNTAVMTINRFYKGDNAFQAFLDSSFAKVKEDNIENLIIDVRENHGLSISFIPALMDYLIDKPFQDFSATIVKSSKAAKECLTMHPAYVSALKAIRKDTNNCLNLILDKVLDNEPGMETTIPNPYTTPSDNKKHRFNGNLYVLTSDETYAEATTFAAAVKDNKLGYIIGEETCNRACSYGLSILKELPNTKINIQIPITYTIRASGNDDGRGVIPDYIVKPTYQDYLYKNDKVLKYAYWLIDKNNN